MTANNPYPAQVKNRGWPVTFARLGINPALGVLYSWSALSRRIPEPWDWSKADKALPHAVACLVFAFIIIPAGRMQDCIGPWVIAALLVNAAAATFILRLPKAAEVAS